MSVVISFGAQLGHTLIHKPLISGLYYSSLNEAEKKLKADDATWVALGDVVTITSEKGDTKLYYVDGTLNTSTQKIDDLKLVPLASGGAAASSGEVKNIRDAVGLTSNTQSSITVNNETFSSVTNVTSALTTLFGITIKKVNDEASATTNEYALVTSDGRQLGSSISIDKDRFLKSACAVTSYTSGGTVITGNAIELKFQTYKEGEYKVDSVYIPVKDLIGIENPLSSVTINGVTTWTISNFNESITISGSDINVGDYTSPTDLYSEWISALGETGITGSHRSSGLTKISGDMTVAEAFQAVEKTIDALSKEVIDDEEVTQAAISAIVSGAGLTDSLEQIKYTPDTSTKYISSATSLYDADLKLDEAIKELDAKVASSVKIASGKTLENLLTVTDNGIDYVDKPIFDCGTI